MVDTAEQKWRSILHDSMYVLDEVLLALAGGVDGRALLSDLLAAAGQEEDTTEHGAENTHGELFYAACQLLFLDSTRMCPILFPCSPSFQDASAERVCRPED